MNTSSHNKTASPWPLRLARLADISAIERLIPLSARALQRGYYSPEQIEAALGIVFGVDRQLISDGTYFLAEDQGTLVGCGGWSRRQSLFGSDQGREVDPELDPSRDAARVRAFFVHPEWARRGIGRSLIAACEKAITHARFQKVELVATLPGEPLYRALNYVAGERFQIPLSDGLMLPVVRMFKKLAGGK